MTERGNYNRSESEQKNIAPNDMVYHKKTGFVGKVSSINGERDAQGNIKKIVEIIMENDTSMADVPDAFDFIENKQDKGTSDQ